MATVYSHPEEIQDLNESLLCSDYEGYKKDMERFEADLKAFCQENSKCPHAGEVIDFPVADGKALYMVLDYRRLIHLPFYDGYGIPDAHTRGLRKADIVQNIERRKAIRELFKSK